MKQRVIVLTLALLAPAMPIRAEANPDSASASTSIDHGATAGLPAAPASSWSGLLQPLLRAVDLDWAELSALTAAGAPPSGELQDPLLTEVERRNRELTRVAEENARRRAELDALEAAVQARQQRIDKIGDETLDLVRRLDALEAANQGAANAVKAPEQP